MNASLPLLMPPSLPIRVPLQESPQAERSAERPSALSLASSPDDALITMFIQGDERAFRFLVERYQERIRNLIFSILRNEELVDDLAQEVFVKAFQALPTFRFESSFYTWLYRIAVNKCRDELRRKKLRSFFSFQSLDNGVRSDLEHRLSSPPPTHEAKDLVTLGLQSLSEHHRTVIVLKDVEGFSYEEIADILQVEVGTVKSRLSRARNALRDILLPLLKERRS